MPKIDKIKTRITLLKDLVFNIIKNYQLVYIIEGAEWSIFWDGRYLTDNIAKFINARCSVTAKYIKNSVIHFGSVDTFISPTGLNKYDPTNKIVLTWFHVVAESEINKYIPLLNNEVSVVHTSCNLSKEKLMTLGLLLEKIVVIPLGVDLCTFRPVTAEKKTEIRKKLGLPLDKIIIGSFQKDGAGWGEGMEPKLIKGPDVFCDAVEKLAKTRSIHVLLTGPARGYVKRRLALAGIPYTHHYLKNYIEISRYYQALDLYLITSRNEGGPKALLESWASGVPLVSTRVGMVPDVAVHEKNCCVADLEDYESIVQWAIKIINDKKFSGELVENALCEVSKYSWENVANEYFNKIYKGLLEK